MIPLDIKDSLIKDSQDSLESPDISCDAPSHSSTKKARIQLSRFSLLTILGICFEIPFIFSNFFISSFKFSLVLFLSGCGGIIISAFLLKRWEERLRKTVAFLVQTKIETLKNEPPEIDPAILLEKEKYNTHLIQYEQDIEGLKKELKEMRTHYEHQADLLHTSIEKSKQTIKDLNLEISRQIDGLHQIHLQNEDLKKENSHLKEDIEEMRKEGHQQLHHKESMLAEYQHTISEQRMIIEKKQRYIAKLEGKVRDLMYEIRSLLQLEESNLSSNFIENSPINAPFEEKNGYFLPLEFSKTQGCTYDLSLHLQRYLEIAKNITGVDHLGYVNGKTPRFLDISFDSYALDLRRLFDLIREETAGIIFVWSPIERKMLFCNNYVKTLLGFSPEKFLKDFPLLVQRGLNELEEGFLQLSKHPQERHLKLVIRNKSGKDHIFECVLGVVVSGPFASYIMGVLGC